MTTRQIQEALKKAGFDPGPIDGVRGRRTIGAVKAFQQANGLTVDGIVGRNTARALFGATATVPERAEVRDEKIVIPPTMPWFEEAFSLLGTEEIPGQGANQAIMGWARALRIDYADDDIPWCGLFVAHCIASQLPEETMPTNPLGARNWGRIGVECTPQPGAVIVFWRGSRSGWKGHVGFYWGEDSHTYHVLGGNQSNAVTISRMKKDRFLNARWPETAPAPTGGPRLVSASGRPITTNEA